MKAGWVNRNQAEIMVNILCCGCGNTFDAHEKACSRCGRCPECGTRVPAGDAHCPTCGHPGNEDSIRELESKLNPSTPENEKAVRWLQREWANERVMDLIRWWWFIPVVLVGVPLSFAAAWAVIAAFGLAAFWSRAIAFFVEALLLSLMVNLLRNGYLPWLLREPKEEDKKKGSG